MLSTTLFPKVAGRCSVNRMVKSILTKQQRPMSFYRNNKNYNDSDKFAWEVAEEAMDAHHLNDTGMLKQTTVHFAELNHTKEFGREASTVGAFGSKTIIRDIDYSTNLAIKLPTHKEIRTPKRLINLAPEFPDKHACGHIIDGKLQPEHDLTQLVYETVPTLPQGNILGG